MNENRPRRPLASGCPGCGRREPHAHDGWAWGTPAKAMAKVEPILIPVTPRQRDVLMELTRDGATNREIARRLGLSVETVKSHLAAVMQTLPLMRDRTALAVALLRGDVRTYVTLVRYARREVARS